MNTLSLFSGIGGLDLGLERAGMTIVGQVESDEWCRRVLRKHWPAVPQHDDVRSAIEWWRSGTRRTVHLIAGGPPCQPSSQSGKGGAQDDPRWLWEPTHEIVEALRPDWVVFENVPGVRRKGLASILARLERAGYVARAGVIHACALGAPHPRPRVFVLAHTDGDVFTRLERGGARSGPSPWQVFDEDWLCRWWATEPAVGRVANGVPRRLDRIRGLGNAVPPQVGAVIGALVMLGTHHHAGGAM